MADSPLLLAVPNVSEGRDHDVIEAIGAGFAHARLLDLHADADHHRSVFTLAAPPAELPGELLGGAREAVEAHRPARARRAFTRAWARWT